MLNEKQKELIAAGACVVVNHSGGKDSQAMLIELRRHVKPEQMLVIHADLAEVEWAGTKEHAQKYCQDLEFLVVKAGKTFFDMVDRGQKWPGAKYRQCTSDLKRDPINKAIIAHSKRTGQKLYLNCTGIRAEESANRSKQNPFKLNARMSKAGREVWDWMPIFDWTKTQVLFEIKKAGQELHWAYAKGMSRLSCAFCVMGAKPDLRIAAKENPELFKKYVEKEREIGKTIFMVKGEKVPLDKYIGMEVEDEQQTEEACA